MPCLIRGWLLGAVTMATLVLAAVPAHAGNDWWRSYEEVEFDDEQSYDGDSFHLRVNSGKRPYDWVIRLYGVDCPETDDRFAERNSEQAEHFGVEAGQIPKLGREAARELRNCLRDARQIRLHVRARGKEKTRRSGSQEQRYYGIVEVVGRDGKSVFLHELMVGKGHARAFGMPAPWPPKTVDRLGEEKAEERFQRDLEQLERKAKRDRLGIWGLSER